MSDERVGPLEFQLLCLAVRPKADLSRSRDILRAGVDPLHLLLLAEHHGVRPSLFRHFCDLAWEAVPAGVRESLEAFQHRHLLRTLTLAEELRRVAGAFVEKAIPLVTFKGVALAKALYGGFADREGNDIDIIVPPSRVGDAEGLLAQLGYSNAQGDAAFRRAFLVRQRQYAFVRGDGIVEIDLHWDFSGTHVPFPLAPDDIWDDPAQVVIGDRRIATISGTNLALLLAGHGTKEAWQALKWVRDFAWMIDRHPDLDWREIHQRARHRRCGDAVLLGCVLAHDLLDIAVPRDLAAPAAASRRVRALAASWTADLRRGRVSPDVVENFTDLALCDGRRDQVRAALKLILTPTPGDHEAMKLPQVMWPAYYVTRPFRLFAKTLAALR